ncbi:hypothetical protein DL96DRAFT_1698141 [Flagelloscypha sp. PMI_526]|nr:hypothetical protein DL96DRAFT_1698141 [Flagelloscypha sp. PMI_526]
MYLLGGLDHQILTRGATDSPVCYLSWCDKWWMLAAASFWDTMVATFVRFGLLAQTLILLPTAIHGEPYNTFDGVGFPACNAVAKVWRPSTVDEMVSIVKNASASNIHVRASGNGHMWYDTMCSDDPNTQIIKTDAVNKISNLTLTNGAGSVIVEAGVTFPQAAEWLHARGASLTYTLVNWNISIGGAVAMGAHRSSLKEESQVSAAALSMDIINGKGELVHVTKDNSDTWLAATTSLGLLGVIARVEIAVVNDFKVYANQTIVDEDDVLNGDLFAEISPYVTANYWWWPGQKKFHKRMYNPVPIETNGNAFQSTFSLTDFEAGVAKPLLESGQNLSSSNFFAETIFYGLWSSPNFHNKQTDTAILFWPTYGWAYDVLIGGLYPNTKTEWDHDMHGMTLELAVPIPQATALLKRVRQKFDEAWDSGHGVTTTYRSGINIKFGKPFDSFLGQTNQRNSDGADWSKGAMMFDFPSYRPNAGDHHRYNEQWYLDLAKTLIDEFPVRPHWTKNTRSVFTQSVKNLNPDSLARFKAVRKVFDPQGTYRSIVGEILGLYA